MGEGSTAPGEPAIQRLKRGQKGFILRTSGGQIENRWRTGGGQMEDRWRTDGGKMEDRRRAPENTSRRNRRFRTNHILSDNIKFLLTSFGKFGFSANF